MVLELLKILWIFVLVKTQLLGKNMYEFLSRTITSTCCQELCAELEDQFISLPRTVHGIARTVYMSTKNFAQNCKNILHVWHDCEPNSGQSECKGTRKLGQASEAAASAERATFDPPQVCARFTQDLCHSRNLQTHRSAKIHHCIHMCIRNTRCIEEKNPYVSFDNKVICLFTMASTLTLRRICLEQSDRCHIGEIQNARTNLCFTLAIPQLGLKPTEL